MGSINPHRLRGALVLMYHRVAELTSDPFSLAVTPERFEEHLEVLQAEYTVIPLGNLVQLVRSGAPTDKCVAVTFDDGYGDVSERAEALLTRYAVPATVFVVTEYVGSTREFMWDELEKVLLQPGVLPAHLRIAINEEVFDWDLGEWAIYPESDYLRHLDWQFEQEVDPTGRHALFRRLYYPLKYCAEGTRRAIMDELLAWAGVDSSARPTHRIMTCDDLRRLVQTHLIEVGAHTMTHAILASLAATIQQEEIGGSRAYLENSLGCRVRGFAYPYGGPTDFTQETISFIREAGYDYACSTFDRLVHAECDLYQLPRVDVKNWNGSEFQSRLRSLSH